METHQLIILIILILAYSGRGAEDAGDVNASPAATAARIHPPARSEGRDPAVGARVEKRKRSD